MIQFYGRKDWDWIVDRMGKEIVISQIITQIDKIKRT